MGCEARDGRMFCNTADVHFGPQCRDDDEAWALVCHLARTRGLDPRILSEDEHERGLAELRSGAAEAMPTHPNKLCSCGSGRPYTSICWYGRAATGTRCSLHPHADAFGEVRGLDGAVERC